MFLINVSHERVWQCCFWNHSHNWGFWFSWPGHRNGGKLSTSGSDKVLTLVRAPSFIIKVPTWLLKFPHSMFSEVLERLPMPMSNSSIPEGCVLQVNPILTLPGANARSHRLRTPPYKTVCAPPPNTRWGGCYPNFWLTVYKVPQLPSHVQLICWSSSQNSETFYLPCCYHLVAKLCPTLLQPHGL